MPNLNMDERQVQSMGRARHGLRMQNVRESENLLLELSTSEPTIQQCFRIIESTCLSQGILCRIEGVEATERFQAFIRMHYVPFCKAAVRAMFTYGFVPWRTRKLSRGDLVPEVLPPGSFSWNTEVGPEVMEKAHPSGRPQGKQHQRQHRAMHAENADDATRVSVYNVTPTAAGLDQDEIRIYIFAPPSLDVTLHSQLFATVSSPLSHLLTDYRNMREAQIRRSHADAWNTTARLISTFKPPLRAADDAIGSSLLDFVHSDYYSAPELGQTQMPPLLATNLWQREYHIRRQFHSNPSNHHPEVYALPKDHDVAQQPMLQPCEDVEALTDKYRRDVSALMGIPYEMIGGQTNGGRDLKARALSSGRLFSTNMDEICYHLQQLLTRVYCAIYQAPLDAVEFMLVPMPRMEVESIEDFKVLYEIGAITPDMSYKISQLLFGYQSKLVTKPAAAQAPGKAGAEFGEGSSRADGKEEQNKESRDDPKRQKQQEQDDPKRQKRDPKEQLKIA